MSEWKTKTLGEVTSYIAKGIPPKYVEKETDDTIVVLNQKCNRNFRISYSESRLHDNSAKRVPDVKMLKRGDVLINSTGTGTAGRVAQILDIEVPTTIDGHMIVMRPTDEIDPLYYGYSVKAYQSVIESYAEGSTGQTEINKTRLQNETLIAYPVDKREQSKIARILEALDEKIFLNEKINNNLRRCILRIS
jgi:type I restriction enzyme S subunit